MKFHTGAVFGGRYTLGERIAVGGMGEVWEATDQVLGRIVAIKLLSPALADQAGFAQRFREEARNTASLSHPNIAALYDYGEDAGANWLVMELVKGRPLSAIIADEAPLSVERTSAIAAQAALALQAAHDRGVVHRDVKPANILVRADGTVKLTDFGISRATDAAPITRTGEVMGTAQYISPEQATGKAVSPGSDLYALGCVMYEMLTARRPFDEGSPVATAMAHVSAPPPPLPAHVPEGLAAIVMACLAKNPSDRPSSGRLVADMLRGAPVNSFPATTPMATVTERLTPATRLAPAGTTATTPGIDDADTPDRTRGPWWWLVPLLLLAAAVVTWAVIAGRADDTTGPAPAPAPATTTTTTRTEAPTQGPTSEAPAPATSDEAPTPTSTPTRTSNAPQTPTRTPSTSVTTPAAPTATREPVDTPTEKNTPSDEDDEPAPADPPSQPADEPDQATPDAPSTGAVGGRAPAGAGAGIPRPATSDLPSAPPTAPKE